MTYLEKWKKKLAEAKDGENFLYILEQMNDEIYEKQCYEKQCFPTQEAIEYELDNCEECKVRWFDSEVKENDENLKKEETKELK